MSKIVFLSLGGNHENTDELLKVSIDKLCEFSTIQPKVSSFYSTPPWGFDADRDFINCIVKIVTHLSPQNLLKEINLIEKELGRIRVGKEYASRPIDIDIVYFGDDVLDTPNLTIPHAKMYDRNFVLVPLNEIAPYWIDPVKNNTVSSLLPLCNDVSNINKI